MRQDRYVRLAQVRPQIYAKYLNGWINRVNSLRTVAAEYAKVTNADKVKTASPGKLNGVA